MIEFTSNETEFCLPKGCYYLTKTTMTITEYSGTVKQEKKLHKYWICLLADHEAEWEIEESAYNGLKQIMCRDAQ